MSRRSRPVRGAALLGATLVALTGCAGATDPTPTADGSDADAGDVSGDGTQPRLAELDVTRPAPESPDAAALAAGLDAAGLRLLLTLPADEDAVLSPLSIGLAFGMADVGAAGGPAEEPLAELFGYPVDGEGRLAAFNTLQQAVTDVGAPTVALANRQFPDTGFEVVEGFDTTLARWFGARVEPLPLQADQEGSRQRINEYVADETQQLIPELVPEGFIKPGSVLVLVNALYLEADWATPFGKYGTEGRPFTRLDGSTVEVPMLHELELGGPAAATDRWAAMEVPYEDEELAMLVLVPAEGGYQDVRARLADGLLDEVDAALAEAPEDLATELWLPRFEATTEVDLLSAFEAAGAEGIFGAEFPGIAPGVFLDAGVHAADVSVDEVGTVAAAATALGFLESGPPEPDVVVDASRPFLWFVRHRATGALLFAGQVTDPQDPGPASAG